MGNVRNVTPQMPKSQYIGVTLGGSITVLSALALAIIVVINGSYATAFQHNKTVMLSFMSAGGASLALFCIALVSWQRIKPKVFEAFYDHRLMEIFKPKNSLPTEKDIELPKEIVGLIFDYCGYNALFLTEVFNVNDPKVLENRVKKFFVSSDQIKQLLIKLCLIIPQIKLAATDHLPDPIDKLSVWAHVSVLEKHQVLSQLFQLGERDKEVLQFIIYYLLHQETTCLQENDSQKLTPATGELLKYVIDPELCGADYDLIITLPNTYLRNLPFELSSSLATSSYEVVLSYSLNCDLFPSNDSDFRYILGLISLFGWARALNVLIEKRREKVLANTNTVCFSNWEARPLDLAITGAVGQARLTRGFPAPADMRTQIKLNLEKGNYQTTIRLLLENNADPSLVNNNSRNAFKHGEINPIATLLPRF